ncbi:macrophage migration inhibitory factor-like protein [Angomonas deanei]|uniref:Uncharacterized protein n=1 Tax=Angomonas deanei TaxID=59799 RepID=S9V8H0_9TRYP|nr:macrophage migration inhibitory factor-like protein [Angomonas deanei]EPY41565.1 macrophage migration inhibitory factor-like protein [Angomonas deanei]CAD2222215.1 hypothetical protein, conserved [Angomonas deanei]|eukprot:EPY39317.1 macrophage migration inhibitory factor-like protein [Angomonas deanei]
MKYNELVLKHQPLDGKSGQSDSLFDFRIRDDSTCALHRYTYNLVKALVHPLHNFLQHHDPNRHNADEIQVMLMPTAGYIAEKAAALQQKSNSLKRPRHPPPPPRVQGRHCYIATNQESLTAETLERAVAGWGVLGVFQISGCSVVHGTPGRHAELKLMEFLANDILQLNVKTWGTNRHPLRKKLPEAHKPIITGERLPCAVCRIAATQYECISRILPSHGHLYFSTIEQEIEKAEGEEKELAKRILLNPEQSSKVLLEKKGRVLTH